MIMDPVTARLNEAFLYLKTQGIIATKKEMADRIAISYHHLVPMFTGKVKLSTKISMLIEREFNISSAWLQQGKGVMMKGYNAIPAGPKSYHADNSIYHVPVEKLPTMMQRKAPDPIKGNLTRWCAPGLVGDYFSFVLMNNDLAPEYEKGSIIVIKKQEAAGLILNANYVFATANELVATKVKEITLKHVISSAGNYKRVDILAVYHIVMGVKIPIK